jgi:hypothetical protein
MFGLATINVVGVTAHATELGDPGGGSAVATPTLALPPGDFFGVPETNAGPGPAAQPPIILGGGQPMLSSGGS